MLMLDPTMCNIALPRGADALTAPANEKVRAPRSCRAALKHFRVKRTRFTVGKCGGENDESRFHPNGNGVSPWAASATAGNHRTPRPAQYRDVETCEAGLRGFRVFR